MFKNNQWLTADEREKEIQILKDKLDSCENKASNHTCKHFKQIVEGKDIQFGCKLFRMSVSVMF